MYSFVYFFIHVFLQRVKSNTNPAFSAFLLVMIFQILNLCTLAVWINYFLKIKFYKNTLVFLGLLLMLILFVLNFFLIYLKRDAVFIKYQKLQIITKYQFIFWLYIVLSVLIYFVSVANLVELR